MKKSFKIITISYLLFAICLIPQAVFADYYFNPNFIITDEEITDYDSLTLNEIQFFLRGKGSALANNYFTDYQGKKKKAAEIIWQAALESQINPKVLLTTLQKEQSLITTAFPSQGQLNKAMGYRCPDDGSCYAGTLDFGKQVDGAAWQFRQYLTNPKSWTYQTGQTYEIDGFLISPANDATAGLYNYTPHYSGNKRFWQIWQSFWGRNYPDGSIVKAPDDKNIWLIQYGLRRLISSYATFLSRFDPRKLLTISKNDLEKYEIGSPIKFPNYSLLRSPEGKIYLVVDDEIRHITSPEVFRIIGFNLEEVVDVVEEDLKGYQKGADITVSSVYPTGALLQNKKTGGVFYVENGIKRPIYSREIMKANFSSKVLTAVSPEELERYQTGEPIKFRDGELIKSNQDSRVYVIANEKRRWIKTEEAFAKFNYKWNNIIVTNQQAVDIHPLGEDLE